VSRELTNAVESEAPEARRAGRREPAERGAQLGESSGARAGLLLSLQQSAGNQAVSGLVQRLRSPDEESLQGKFAPVQRQGEEEEEPLQGKFAPVQRQGEEEEEPLQGKFAPVQRQGEEEEEPLQGKFAPVQRQGEEEEEPVQGRFAPVQFHGDHDEELQMKAAPAARQRESVARRNETGLPDGLKSGIESLSGMSLDDVQVHYNSAQPAQLNALAYAQGTDIHVAPGQEQHLPHEAWHVVQQAQGRVQPTMQLEGGVPVNDDHTLEHEADTMGERASNLITPSP